MTAGSIRIGTADDEVLRIWTDDDPEPVVQVLLRDALDGTADEVFAPPFGAGRSTCLAWYYPVAFSAKAIVAIDRLGEFDVYYHQVDAVLDPTPVDRTPATDAADARASARAQLEADPPIDEELTAEDIILAGGATESVLAHSGAATIERIRIGFAPEARESLMDVRVRGIFDEETTFDVPLGALFASALAAPTNTSLALAGTATKDAVTVELRLPMPFAASADISIENTSDEDITLEWATALGSEVPEGEWGRLHAQYNDTQGPTEVAHHPLASVDGRGRLVGTCVMLDGHSLGDGSILSGSLNFLEGDDRTYIDGELTVEGTGTEDFLNSSFYFVDGPRATPFAQSWGIDPAVGGDAERAQVSACRWYVLTDTIDFETSLEQDLEIGPGTPDLLNRYQSIVFYYL